MVAQFVVFVLSFAQFSENWNFKGNMRKNCKCYYKKPIDDNFPWSSVIDVRNDVKKLKKNAQCNRSPAAPGSTRVWTALTSFRYDLLNLIYRPKMINPEKNSVSYSKTSNTTHWMYYSVPFRRVWRVICFWSRYHRRSSGHCLQTSFSH